MDENLKEREVKIFVANKGGCGKTLFSLVSILHGYFEGKKVVAIDLNFENPDTATILHGIVEGKTVVEAPIINEGTPLAYRQEKVNDRLYSIRPHPLYSHEYKLWTFLDQFLYKNGNDFDLVVVDTGWNLTNLAPPEGDRWPKTRVIPTIYQVYTWSTSLRPWEIAAFDTTISRLETFFDRKSEAFLVHVLNPQAFIPKNFGASMKYVTAAQYMFDGTTDARKILKHLAKKGTTERIGWDTFKKELLLEVRNEFWKIPAGDMWKDEIPSIWMTVMKSFLKKRQALPLNILFHPYIYHTVALIVDDLIIRRGKNLETIKELVQPVYENYQEFCEAYAVTPEPPATQASTEPEPA